MKNKLNILMVASECVPFAKTGGLADVVGALAPVLKKLGHDVRVVMPKYSFIDTNKFKIKPFLEPMGVWMGTLEEWCGVYTTTIEEDVPVYFIDFDLYFGRDGLYHDAFFNDYIDNPFRFGFLSRASLQLCKSIGFKPDIVHSNDWQTGLTAAYLKIWHWNDPILGGAASLLTIHNLAYQGIYSKYSYNYLGLGEENFTANKFETYGQINFLKGGVYFADMVNTVSPTYANETRTPEGGYGMALYLNDKEENYVGILNGIDYSIWNPEKDKLIPANYSAKDLSGKKVCKRELQKRFNLKIKENVPIIGVVSRLVEQKGLHILADAIEPILNDIEVQFVVLGSGNTLLEDYFRSLDSRYQGNVGTYIGYNNDIAHLIEAGSDFFIMPSIYEPCGLNQIYSLKYGTLPIVRATGGLDDTVEQYNEKTGEGSGFKFWDISSQAIYNTVRWAVSTYYDRRKHLDKMIQYAMSKHFSWEDSAKKYIEVYEKALENKSKL